MAKSSNLDPKENRNDGKGIMRRRRKKAQTRDEADTFIDEVTEELRTERLTKRVKTWSPWVGAVLVGVVVAVGVLEYMNASAINAARALGGQLLAAEAESDPAVASGQYLTVAQSAENLEAATIARLLAADRKREAGDIPAARALYAEIAENATLPPRYRDLAVLKSVFLDADTADPMQLIAMLEPLTEPEAPYRSIALEQISLAYLRAGNVPEARLALQDAAADPTITMSQAQRLAALLDATPAPAETGDQPDAADQ